jgi:hypothetical protein
MLFTLITRILTYFNAIEIILFLTFTFLINMIRVASSVLQSNTLPTVFAKNTK